MLTVLSVMGSVAFAVSGAMVAIEEDYDIFGILVLGLITAFAGGMIRNLIVGLSVAPVWHQTGSFLAALAAMVMAMILPTSWMTSARWLMAMFDAVGLSTFAVQGALYADGTHLPVGAVIIAAMMTGIGGGVVRDLLAQRKPLVLRADAYAVWTLLAGAVIALGWVNPHIDWQIYGVLAGTFVLRCLSMIFHWKLPHATRHPFHESGLSHRGG